MSITKAEPRVGSNEANLKRLEEYQKAGCHIVYLCDPWHLPELHRLHVEAVKINPDPAAGEIFKPAGASNFVLNLRALERLAVAAALKWHPEHTRVVTLNSSFCHYQAVGTVYREYQDYITFRGDAYMNLDHLKEDLLAQYQAKAKKDKQNDDWIKFCVARDFTAKRKNMLKLVESDAKGIVMRKLLGAQGVWKTPKIFENPFIIVRCVFGPDLHDPQERKLALEYSLQRMSGVYSGDMATGPVHLLNAEPPAPGPAPANDIAEAEAVDIPDGDNAPPEPPQNDFLGDEPPTPEELLEADFETADAHGRAEMLVTAAEAKDFDIAAWVLNKTKRELSEQTEVYLAQLWDYVKTL